MCVGEVRAGAAEESIHPRQVDRVLVRRPLAVDRAGVPQDDLDGLTVDCGDWWFNLRPSNTEPLLRLNLEAADRDACDNRVAELLALITT